MSQKFNPQNLPNSSTVLFLKIPTPHCNLRPLPLMAGLGWCSITAGCIDQRVAGGTFPWFPAWPANGSPLFHPRESPRATGTLKISNKKSQQLAMMDGDLFFRSWFVGTLKSLLVGNPSLTQVFLGPQMAWQTRPHNPLSIKKFRNLDLGFDKCIPRVVNFTAFKVLAKSIQSNHILLYAISNLYDLYAECRYICVVSYRALGYKIGMCKNVISTARKSQFPGRYVYRISQEYL